MNRTTNILTAVITLGVSLNLLGCATNAPAQSSAVPTPSAHKPIPEAAENMHETAIRITVRNQILDATLAQNPAANTLADQLPLTLEFQDYGGQEVTAKPPQPLNMEGMPSAQSAPVGTIGYYAPNQVIVLYYANVGRFKGLMRLGQISGDLSVLEEWKVARPVTIELAEVVYP